MGLDVVQHGTEFSPFPGIVSPGGRRLEYPRDVVGRA